jgi:hypothetical protein
MYLKIQQRRKWKKLPVAPFFATLVSVRALPHQFLLKVSDCVANFVLGSASVAAFLVRKKQNLTKSSFFNH